ncbi:response regulator [Psychrosphaera sp. B3R10]|uniref:response regulator n=1 Tax=unclassified Psychrosphaera TaxID=2641570 RepID=UPI001C09438A|nr:MULTISPECIES: HD domain-containing phosphohydrolase [unclassified Psychrosphaera]MBU2881775.1 response regulator [Psychrosphaera sp. I2R16]MBU2990140.1 response regulator [Psychrosphaera sp. B3R10]MDO6719916.1 response regulator [Psychrosphaera sp. 1_MG-2023]
MHPTKQNVLVVDDEPTNLKVLNNILKDMYKLTFAKSGQEALRLIEKDKPDLILLDVMMPEMTGYEVCETLKQSSLYKSIPVIFVTALNDAVDEAKGLNIGAVDYISKPVTPAVVKARVKTHLSLVDAEELRRTRLQVIQRLGRASEYKDNETGMHVMRMSHYAKVVALAYGYSEEQADNLFNAAPMHDIGKIGIPDAIMLKPGKLTDEEFAEMKKHPEIGAEILGDSDSELIELAKVVSMTHHEKWDGTGYPNQLKGEEIPLEGRIVALADVFDALTSVRPYKDAWSIEKALDFITSQKYKHFDPQLVDLFISKIDDIIKIKEQWKD